MCAAVATGASQLVPGADPNKAVLWLRSARLQRMDRLCASALVAADGALANAGFDAASLARVCSERIAIVVGARFGCHATNEEYFRGLLAEGPRGASPRLFAYTLPSSPLGELAIHFGARGAAQTVASGRHAGLEAVARAASLCVRGRADVALAVAVEAGGGTVAGSEVVDGAAAVVVESEETARAAGRAPLARVAGSGIAFASEDPDSATKLACTRAFASAGLPPHALAAIAADGGAGAVDAMAAFVTWLRSAPGEGAVGLALSADPMGGAAALLALAYGQPAPLAAGP